MNSAGCKQVCFWTILVLVSVGPFANGQTDSSKQAVNSHSEQVTSPNIALYLFLRAAAADDQSAVEDKARSEAMIREIGLSDTDGLALQSIFNEYSASVRLLHDASLARTADDLQRGEMQSYVQVIRRLHSELSPAGRELLRSHLARKMTKMQFHKREVPQQ